MASLINVTVFKKNLAKAETFYNIDKVEKIIEEKEEEKLLVKHNSKSTNKAYNTTKNNKYEATTFKVIAPPEDYVKPTFETNNSKTKAEKSSKENSGNSSISEELMTSFNSVNAIISKRKNSQNAAQSAAVNNNSTIYYSLKGRTDKYLPIPIYLCNANGKIVVNIVVDSKGDVVGTKINNAASTSQNACLQDHALEYAKEARFNAQYTERELGTITFIFKE